MFSWFVVFVSDYLFIFKFKFFFQLEKSEKLTPLKNVSVKHVTKVQWTPCVTLLPFSLVSFPQKRFGEYCLVSVKTANYYCSQLVGNCSWLVRLVKFLFEYLFKSCLQVVGNWSRLVRLVKFLFEYLSES